MGTANASQNSTDSEPTHGGELTQHLHRPRKRFKQVAVLTPANADKIEGASEFRLESGELVIGRDAQCNAVIPDVSVSRRHSRLGRVENDFVIEDLGSRNGTYVDGVAVMSCVLRGGDEVQIGRYLFYFDYLLEPVELAQLPP